MVHCKHYKADTNRHPDAHKLKKPMAYGRPKNLRCVNTHTLQASHFISKISISKCATQADSACSPHLLLLYLGLAHRKCGGSRGVNETLPGETETRPRHSRSKTETRPRCSRSETETRPRRCGLGPRRDRDDKNVSRPRPRLISLLGGRKWCEFAPHRS